MKLGNVLATALLCLSAAATQASTVLTPTDTNVNFYVYDSSYTLAVFDQAAELTTANALEVLMGPSLPGLFGGTVNFLPYANPSVTAYFANNGVTTLDLGGTNEFIVGLSLDNGATWLADDMSQAIVSTNGYIASLVFGDGVNAIAVDVAVAAVPVPAAVWLFGTGLIGLAGVARRRS